MNFDRNFPKTKPKRVRDGIKAQSQRGTFGTKWWARRWIDVLEKLLIGGRLARGRSYARAGQVLDIAVEPGCASAKVQGSRAKPYSITIRVATLDAAQWRSVTETIVAEARFAAKLLAGEMPQEIEQAFASAGVSLFPESAAELQTECSCPDWSNPCKHIAAVYYLLGEEFDRDPFLLFALRGGSKGEIFAGLVEAESSTAELAADEPLPLDLTAFWSSADRDDPSNDLAPGPSARRSTRLAIPAFPFWRGCEPLVEFLTRVDDRAAASATERLLSGNDVECLKDP